MDGGIYKTDAGGAILEQRYRELLELWPVANEHLHLSTKQGETFVVASGPADGPPVILLHGSSGNAAVWGGDIASWAASFRVYAVDLIGEPGLSAPSRPPYDSGAYASWLDEVLTGLGVSKAAFVAESLGGWVALDYAIRRRERVERLAMRCPAGIGRQTWGVIPYAILNLPFGRRGLERTLRYATGTTPPPQVVEYMLTISEHFNPRGQLPVFGNDQLRTLTLPLSVTVGGRDRLLDSAETVRRLAVTVPHASVTLLPEVGHLLPAQTEEILAFLRG